MCERLCLARRCNQDQGRQQALSPGKQSPSSQPGPELAMTQEEILEVKLLTVLEGFYVTWGAEKAPTGELLHVRNALPGEVVAGFGSGCIRAPPSSLWLAAGLKRDCRR